MVFLNEKKIKFKSRFQDQDQIKVNTKVNAIDVLHFPTFFIQKHFLFSFEIADQSFES